MVTKTVQQGKMRVIVVSIVSFMYTCKQGSIIFKFQLALGTSLISSFCQPIHGFYKRKKLYQWEKVAGVMTCVTTVFHLEL